MKELNNQNIEGRASYPVKVIQFGEGNFLRAFVDWMFHQANKKGNLNAGVVVVQPLDFGMVDMLKKQDCLYHVALEGIKDGQPIKENELIDCIVDAVNPYKEYQAYKDYFLSPELELVVSNTTEAGITRIDDEDITALPPKSFPGKVCQLLFERYKKFEGDKSKGLVFFCCELIDKNASKLKEIVLELAEQNKLEAGFVDWVNSACTFCNTLVDRIVPGFPKDTIDEVQTELGYKDNLVVKGEYFHLWAIEAPKEVSKRFPFDKYGLNVVWLDDMTKFRDKKVRVLNGSHTALVPVGLLSGHETVKEAFDDKLVSQFILDMVDQEVLPNIQGEIADLKKFAAEILERFFNPFIRHFLKDISLNSLSKWMTRDYPTVADNLKNKGELPNHVTFSLAALLILYKGEYNGLTFEIKDTPEFVEFIQAEWAKEQPTAELVANILGNNKIWGEDLSAVEGLAPKIVGYIDSILNDGMKKAVQSCC